jgi:hypothetical protein
MSVAQGRVSFLLLLDDSIFVRDLPALHSTDDICLALFVLLRLADGWPGVGIWFGIGGVWVWMGWVWTCICDAGFACMESQYYRLAWICRWIISCPHDTMGLERCIDRAPFTYRQW